jgi:outer membrane protein OmpA-like peptidoglycan-associated protein
MEKGMKKTKLFLTMFLLMNASFFAQQVQTGTYKFDKKLADYTLDKPGGDRVVQMEVNFPKPFDVKPEVMVTVNFIDADKGANNRFEVKTISVSRDGFTIQVKTWSDTKIYGIGGDWMAEAIKLEIKKENIEVGKTFELNNVYFEFDKATLLPASYPELDIVVQLLKENPKVEIELSGHTDNVGKKDYNITLSKKRAESCKKYIISKGINTKRITAKGYGMNKPVQSNDTEIGREKNRRVEFMITKK